MCSGISQMFCTLFILSTALEPRLSAQNALLCLPVSSPASFPLKWLNCSVQFKGSHKDQAKSASFLTLRFSLFSPGLVSCCKTKVHRQLPQHSQSHWKTLSCSSSCSTCFRAQGSTTTEFQVHCHVLVSHMCQAQHHLLGVQR